MVLGFKKQFVAPILAGTKIHSIREDKHRRWSTGKAIHMATGVRQPTYSCFKKSTVTGIQHVFMSVEIDGLHISVNCREIENHFEKQKLAINDGFESWEQLEDWFLPLVEKEEGKVFTGRLIHWTDLRY